MRLDGSALEGMAEDRVGGERERAKRVLPLGDLKYILLHPLCGEPRNHHGILNLLVRFIIDGSYKTNGVSTSVIPT